MGDENSLQGRTQAHKHELASSTGGFLETGITGMTNLSNGSLIMGDASEIQTELSGGNNLDVLTMGAAVPAWVAPAAAAGGALEFVEEITLGADTSSWLLSLSSAHVMADYDSLIAEIVIRNNAGSNPNVTYRVNGISTPSYTTNSMQTATGTVTGFNSGGQTSARVLTNWVGTGAAMINLEVFDNSARTGRDYTDFTVAADDNIYSNGMLFTETDFASVSSMTISLSAGDILAAGARARFYRVKKT